MTCYRKHFSLLKMECQNLLRFQRYMNKVNCLNTWLARIVFIGIAFQKVFYRFCQRLILGIEERESCLIPANATIAIYCYCFPERSTCPIQIIVPSEGKCFLQNAPAETPFFPGLSSGKSERETADPVDALLSPEYQSGFYQADLPDS